MNKALVCAAFAALLATNAFAVRLGTLDAKGYPVIIPTVKKLTPMPGAFALKGDDKAVLESVEEELTERGVPDSKEGYVLTVSSRGIKVRARNRVGLFYGKKSVEWMLKNREGDALKCCTIEDWPDVRMRGILLEMNDLRPDQMPRMCRVLEGLALLKNNMVLCDFADNFPLSINGEFNRKTTLSKDDIAMFKAAAKANHITIIPYLQVASHALWITRHKDWESLREGDCPINWNSMYCLKNPEAQRIVETIVRETADELQPKIFHLCHDEMQGCPHGVCPRCKGTPPVKLFWDHAKPIHDMLFARGIRPMTYEGEFCDNVPGRGQTNYVAALNWFDKRVVFNVGEYGPYVPPAIRNELSAKGFNNVIYMPWSCRPLNTMTLARLAKRVDVPGFVLAYWLNLGATHGPNGGVYTYLATINSAVYTWNAAAPDFTRQPFDAHDMFRRAFDDEPRVTFAAPPRPLPLSGSFNALVGGGGRYPAFDAKTLAQLKREVAADREGFDLTVVRDRLAAVVVAGSTNETDLVREVRIPVGAKTEGFSFLLASAPENTFLVDYYHTPRTVARLEIAYEDGSKAKFPLRRNREIIEWNSFCGAYFARIVSRVNDAEGSIVNLYATDWKNPKPDLAVREIVLKSADHERQTPMIFAAATHGDAPAVPKTAAKPRPLPNGKSAALEPLFDFSAGTMDGLTFLIPSMGKDAKVERSIEKTERGPGLVVKVPKPEKEKYYSLKVRFPLRPDQDFETFAVDFYVDRPEEINRADIYVNGRNGGCIGRLFYNRAFAPGWTRINLPKAVMNNKEGGGIGPDGYASVSMSFIFANEKPFTMKFANPAVSKAVEPEGFNLKLPVE